ncbi:MAG: 50S ribosomal protein L11 [Candidatus Diapherotrites archaeon CG11_big_fil_rev_8_21_14_0_20_37_9]|nr:MAG: 50S ribosomal protein L11 [Candidatus Diapherotrites archaeon CG11_big_fil_rev_8_21_14_0_20_37_9]
MAEISVLIEGGKATAGAPLGPALGPLGVNIGDVVAQINEKTKNYSGMKVPVTVEVDSKKHIEISVGSPPTSALIVKELKAKKGGAHQLNDTVGNLSMDQVKKLAEMKVDALNSSNLYAAAREIIGTCNSMAVTIEGKRAKEMQKEFKEGKWDSFFGKTEKSAVKVEKAVAKAENVVEIVIEKTAKVVKEVTEKTTEKVKEVVSHEAEKAKEETKKIAKESYSKHISTVEKELGITKEEPEEKKVETETVKLGSNTEITRPKKGN